MLNLRCKEAGTHEHEKAAGSNVLRCRWKSAGTVASAQRWRQ